VRLATQYDRIHGAGAEVISVSVDDEVRQAGMTRRWGLPSTRFVADPGGTRILEPLGLYDPDERDGIALTALVVIDPEGTERHRYVGRDFADRTADDDVLDVLDGLGLPPIDAPRWAPEVEIPDDLRGYFRTDNLWPYLRGNMFGAVAISRRVEDPAAVAVAKQHQAMSKSLGEAVEQWKQNFGD
jgi:hypothetical protein